MRYLVSGLIVSTFLISPAIGQVTINGNISVNGNLTVDKSNPPAALYSCSENNTGSLMAYWKLDDNSGTSAVDTTTGSYTGTLTAGPTWGTGTCGSDVVFTAANSQYIAIANDASGIIGTFITAAPKQFSISAWFKTTLTTSECIYSEGKAGASDTPFIALAVNDSAVGGVDFLIRDDSGNDGRYGSTTKTYNDGNWHHAVLVQRATNDKEIYVDGASQGTNTTQCDFSGGQLTVANIGRLERQSIGNYFDGSIDQVRVYNIALTAGQVSSLYASGK